MLTNVGGADRAIRFLVGAVALALTVTGPKTPLGYLGLIPLATAALGWCPLYTIFGISSCKKPAL